MIDALTVPLLYAIGMMLLTLAFHVWRLQPLPGVQTFATMLILIGTWALLYIPEITGTDPDVRLALHQSTLALLAFGPLLWVIFALRFTLHDHYLTRPRLIMLLIPSAVMAGLILTNSRHHLVWDAVHIVNNGGNLELHLHRSLLAFVYWGIYTPVLMIVGLVLVARYLMRNHHIYRLQAVLISVAILMPTGAGFVATLHGASSNEYPINLFSTVFAIAIITVAIFRYRLFYATPITPANLIESMPDSVLVLDHQRCLMNANRAALQLLRLAPLRMIGRPVELALAEWPEIVASLETLPAPTHTIALRNNGNTLHYEVSVQAIEGKAPGLGGWLIRMTDVTRHRSVEHALANTEMRYRMVINNLQEVVFQVDNLGCWSFLSRRWPELTGYAIQETLVKPARRFFHPDDMRQVIRSLREAGQNDQLVLMVRLCNKAGDYIPVRVAFRVLYAPNGKIQIITGTLADLREQEAAEAKARRGEAIVTAVHLAASQLLKSGDWEQGIYQVLAQLGEVTQASRVRLYREITVREDRFRYNQVAAWSSTPEDLALEQWHYTDISLPVFTYPEIARQLRAGELITTGTADFPDQIRDMIQQINIRSLAIIAVQVERGVWGYMAVSHAEEAHQWSSAEREAIQTAAGIVSAAIQRRQAETAIRKRQQILDAVNFAAARFLESSDWSASIESVLARLGMSADVCRVYICRRQQDSGGAAAFSQTYLWTHPDFEDVRIIGLLKDIPLSPNFERWRCRFDQGQPVHGPTLRLPTCEQPLLTALGVRSVLVVPIKIMGDWWGFIGCDDCSSEREWDDYEINGLQAAADIMGAAIYRSQIDASARHYAQELEARNRDLDDFNRMVAHDLKSPIHSIVSATQMVRERFEADLPSPAQNYLRDIEARGQLVADTVSQLLALARSRQADDQGEPVNMRMAVQAALYRHATAVEEFNINVDVASTLPQAQGHFPWVVEVFDNLISNAIKYRGEDNPCPTIKISGRVILDHAYFEVTDNGIGIANEGQSRLFELFTRAHDDSVAGNGMGLSIVRRLVNNMNGMVDVESTLGQGSRFWFTLPARPQRAGQASAEVVS